MRNVTRALVVTLTVNAIVIGGALAPPSQLTSGVEVEKRGVILVEDPITWIRGRSCPYGLAVVAKRYNKKLGIWQVKCAS